MARFSTASVDPLRAARAGIAFLLLDGIRRRPAGPSAGVVLCAVGLDGTGLPYPLTWRPAPAEEEGTWRAVLADLQAAGVGSDLLLIGCDGHPALLKAVGAVFPEVVTQISVPHRLLALSRKVSPRVRKACLLEARAIFAADDRETAVARFRAWEARWLRQGELAVRSLEADLAACLAFYRFPSHLWPKIRTVNLVERTFRDVRRAEGSGADVPEPADLAAAGVEAREQAPQSDDPPAFVSVDWEQPSTPTEPDTGAAAQPMDLGADPDGSGRGEAFTPAAARSTALIILTALAGFLVGLLIAGVF